MNDMRQFEFAASAQQALRECEERFRSLLDLSSDWYWEQDDQFRFTQFMGGVFEKSGIDVRQYLGRTRWQAGGLPMHADNWDDHLALMQARGSVAEFTYSSPNALGDLRWICASGQPFFDGEGDFLGYRGVAKDITERVRSAQREALEHAVTSLLADC